MLRSPSRLCSMGARLLAGAGMNCIIVALTVASLMVGTALAAPAGQKGRPSKSDVCGECHRDIYKMWRGSAHAQAMDDPIFLEAYKETERRVGSSVTHICLGCHAPAAGIIKDFDLEQKVSWEGVSCDICHGISDVQMLDTGPKLSFDIGLVKRGPIQDATSMAHQVMYSELHTTAKVCAPCHEYKNAEGTAIMTTYSEWLKSTAAAELKICQDCHMSRTQAEVVDPRVARAPGAQVNLHEVPGGHSLTQLNKALAVTLKSSRASGQLTVDVGLKNTGAGHSVPTGMPGRRVILDLSVKTSDGQSYSEQKIYGESFADSSGATIERDSGYFARGAKLVADNRIASGEQKNETFRFPVAKPATAYVSLKLHYEHSPTGTKENRTYITFYSTERMVAPETSARQ